MVRAQFLLALTLLVGACDGDPHAPAGPAPAPAPVAQSATLSGPTATAVAPVESIPRVSGQSQASDDPEDPAVLDPAGVLDDEERRLLEADDATLTKDERVDRARAQRKLVMADPEHPLRPVLAKVEAEVASGEARTKAQERWSGRSAFPPQGDAEGAPPRG